MVSRRRREKDKQRKRGERKRQRTRKRRCGRPQQSDEESELIWFKTDDLLKHQLLLIHLGRPDSLKGRKVTK